MNSNLRQIGFLTSKVHFVCQILYYSISVYVLSSSTVSFFCSYGKRTGVICGFGGTQNDIGSFVRILLIITEPPSFKTFL
jgi:hypothetical protein